MTCGASADQSSGRHQGGGWVRKMEPGWSVMGQASASPGWAVAAPCLPLCPTPLEECRRLRTLQRVPGPAIPDPAAWRWRGE